MAYAHVPGKLGKTEDILVITTKILNFLAISSGTFDQLYSISTRSVSSTGSECLTTTCNEQHGPGQDKVSMIPLNWLHYTDAAINIPVVINTSSKMTHKVFAFGLNMCR